MLLVFRKYRNTVAAEAYKVGNFLEVNIYSILCGEYARVQKVFCREV